MSDEARRRREILAELSKIGPCLPGSLVEPYQDVQHPRLPLPRRPLGAARALPGLDEEGRRQDPHQRAQRGAVRASTAPGRKLPPPAPARGRAGTALGPHHGPGRGLARARPASTRSAQGSFSWWGKGGLKLGNCPQNPKQTSCSGRFCRRPTRPDTIASTNQRALIPRRHNPGR